MRVEYDQTADALYIRLVDGEGLVSRTEQIDAGTLVDVDERGEALGIEVIRPARPVPIHEIVERFRLGAEVAQFLVTVWRDELDLDSRFPFGGESKLASAAG